MDCSREVDFFLLRANRFRRLSLFFRLFFPNSFVSRRVFLIRSYYADNIRDLQCKAIFFPCWLKSYEIYWLFADLPCNSRCCHPTSSSLQGRTSNFQQDRLDKIQARWTDPSPSVKEVTPPTSWSTSRWQTFWKSWKRSSRTNIDSSEKSSTEAAKIAFSVRSL